MQSEVIGDEKTNELDEDVDAVVQAHRSTPVCLVYVGRSRTDILSVQNLFSFLKKSSYNQSFIYVIYL